MDTILAITGQPFKMGLLDAYATQPDDGFLSMTVNLAICRRRPQPLRNRPPPLISDFGFGHKAAI